MDAAQPNAERGTSATPHVVLRVEVFDTLTAKFGATTDVARAELLGVDRATLQRLRKRKFHPRIATALRMADRLGTTFDELFERVAA